MNVKTHKLGNIYPSNGQNGNIYHYDSICPTISAGVTNNPNSGGIGSSNAPKFLCRMRDDNLYRIRKLLPEECFALMGMEKSDAFKCRELGISDTQLYKQAGNGIVTTCIEAIMQHLYKAQYEHSIDYKCNDELPDSNYHAEPIADKIPISANILFSGIGCQDRGIKNSGVFDLTVVNTSDICHNATVSYAAIHCGLTNELINQYDYPSREQMIQDLISIDLGYEPVKDKHKDWNKLLKSKHLELEKYWLAAKLSKQLGNISQIQRLDYADIWTYSYPCTDLSRAGKQLGMIKGVTRSGLLYEVQRLLSVAETENNLPKYLLLENVSDLVSKKFISQFNEWIQWLSDIKYNTYYDVIDATYCGTPQHRERCFAVSIRKDIDTHNFKFPKPYYNGLVTNDYLEDSYTVDEKYFITGDKVDELIDNLDSNTLFPNDTQSLLW